MSNIPSTQYDIISKAKGTPSFLKACGEALQRSNCIANDVVAAVGILDGDVTVGDAINGIAAACGTLGLWTSWTPLGLTLDGISLVLTIAGAIVSASENNSSNGY